MSNQKNMLVSYLRKLANQYREWFATQPAIDTDYNKVAFMETLNTFVLAIESDQPSAIIWEALTHHEHQAPWDWELGPELWPLMWEELLEATSNYRNQPEMHSIERHGDYLSGFTVLLTDGEQAIVSELPTRVLNHYHQQGGHGIAINRGLAIESLSVATAQSKRNSIKTIENIEFNMNYHSEISADIRAFTQTEAAYLEAEKTGSSLSNLDPTYQWALVQSKPSNTLSPEEVSLSEQLNIPTKEDYLHELEYPPSSLRP